MDGEWVSPEAVLVLRIADGDVATHTFGVAVARPVTEDGGHVVECPSSVSCEGRKGGDSYSERRINSIDTSSSSSSSIVDGLIDSRSIPVSFIGP